MFWGKSTTLNPMVSWPIQTYNDTHFIYVSRHYNDLLMLRISKCFSKSLDIIFKLCTTLISKANKCGQDKKRLWIHCWLLSIKDCVLYEWKIAGSFILKDCLFFQNERIKQSFKIKESCNLSFIQYAIFDWNKSILLTRKIDQIFQIKRIKRSFRST